jgi:hypothetical protein
MPGGIDDSTHGGPFFAEMPCKPNPGIYGKFVVQRTDGGSRPGKKHHGCDYFVLDLTHDRHAVAAIAAYVLSCEQEKPELAEDLNLWLASKGALGDG